VRLPDFARTTTFRSTLTISGVFVVCTLLIFEIVLWQTSAYLTANVDQLVDNMAKSVIAGDLVRTGERLEDQLRSDPRRVKLGGLFDPAGNRISGNIESLPPGLAVDSEPKSASVSRIEDTGRRTQTARVVLQQLPGGATLIIGRGLDEAPEIFNITQRVVIFGLLAALCLGLTAGAWLSIRTQKRLEEMNKRIQRIVAGELRARVPTTGSNDPLDRLAVLVNAMLDNIETLVQNLASVGDDIAHDLRTPLARVRIGLERARANATSLPDLQTAVDRALARIDHAISIITALLRIREIEQTRRLVGFETVGMAELLHEVAELYQPFAEDKRLAFSVKVDLELLAHGDHDLLFEAIANLVDNAVKFTPEGGTIELRLTRRGESGIVQVSDSGPGITESERDLIVRRFYRSDRSRSTKGLGLGLSLVTAIVKLHGFRFNVMPGPGFVAEIAFQPTRARKRAPEPGRLAIR
jgi:signal transduction histidine kinase